MYIIIRPKIMIREKDVNEVYPNLWLGNLKAAYNQNFLERHNIKYILTVMDNFDGTRRLRGINYLVIPIRDKNIANNDLRNTFDVSTLFIQNALKDKRPILIHCKNGHHRSAAVVAAFMIDKLKMDYNDTVKYIKTIRPLALRRKTNITDQLKLCYCR